MITELKYSDIINYIEQLCTQNKLVKHSPHEKHLFMGDDDFKGNSLKSPAVLFFPGTSIVIDAETDSEIETFPFTLLILSTAKSGDNKDKIEKTDLCKKIADQFVKRIIRDCGFADSSFDNADKAIFIYHEIRRISKTPVPFLMYDAKWGGYELQITLGAPTLMDHNPDDWQD